MNDDPAVEALLGAARSRGWMIAVAESCTGGELCTRLSALPGSSSAFLGGVIPYADSVKSALLGVSPSLISSHGAVSSEVALAMARGVRERLGADIGLGITGIAGPAGARPGKPVGLVYIAVSAPVGEDDVRRYELSGARADIRFASVEASLELLTEVLTK